VFKEFWPKKHRRLVTPGGGKWIRPTLTTSNTCFLRPTRVSLPNGISIGSAVFCRALKRDQKTHRQTDHGTPCVAVGRFLSLAIAEIRLNSNFRTEKHTNFDASAQFYAVLYEHRNGPPCWTDNRMDTLPSRWLEGPHNVSSIAATLSCSNWCNHHSRSYRPL